MKGKREFTGSEVKKIKNLIEQKVNASSYDQKAIRNKIRKLGFYYSDFSNKHVYTVDDFNDLGISGKIEIINHTRPNSLIIEKSSETINELIIENCDFKDISDISNEILNCTGLYFIRLKKNSILPERYQRILDTRKYKLIYIGKAEGQILRNRLKEELKHKGPGTFFRSIGCVLRYKPMFGHLKGKANQNNYKFSSEETLKIIDWLENNIEICIKEYNDDFDLEIGLIKEYRPLLNDRHNPLCLKELKDDKKECRRIARGE